MRMKYLAILLIAGLLMPSVLAQVEYVYVDLLFNIGAVDKLTVTLLGQSSVTSSPTGQATPANIEFSVNADALWQNASVVAGSTQDLTNPIMALDNTGSTNLGINLTINASLPAAACDMKLRYLSDPSAYSVAGVVVDTTGSSINSTSNATIDSSFTPAEAS